MVGQIDKEIKGNILLMKDEIHAYIATGLRRGMVSPFDYLRNWVVIEQIRMVFEDHYEEIEND